MKKLMIIDGSSLAYRAFHALPLLTTSSGMFINAAYGFTMMLQRIVKQEQPDYLAVAFDKSRITFRTEEYAEYKAQRKATPEELRPQFTLIKKVLAAYKIPVLEQSGFEGDDLIGTVVKAAEARGLSVLIVSGDRDLLQLVSEQTKALITHKGITDLECFAPPDVMEKYGITPDQVPDLKGLKGDSSDNIPGVPGIGPKTALKMIEQFGSMESCLEHLPDLPKRAAVLLEQYRSQAIMSKKLATIRTDVPVEIDFEALKMEQPDYQELATLFQQLEFRMLLKNLQAEMPAPRQSSLFTVEGHLPADQSASDELLIKDARALADLISEVRVSGRLAVCFERGKAIPLQAQWNRVGLSWGDQQSALVELPVNPDRRRALLEKLTQLLSDQSIEKWCHDVKAEMETWHQAPAMVGITGDTMLAAYLLNPSTSSPTLEELSIKYREETGALILQGDDSPARRAQAVYRLWPLLKAELEDDELYALFDQVELPLSTVLARMEGYGVKVDVSQLDVMSDEFSTQLVALTTQIFDLAGEDFNINSPKQLGYILFEKLKLPVAKKTKTGFSTNAEVLESLVPYHDIAAKLLEFRMLMKLKSTYIDGLRNLIDKQTGKIHTTYNQTITATGRLSSTEPNLQNIPIRVELGRKIRRAFIPSEPGWSMLAADYSQIELRILAHMSHDERLIEAFRQGEDIHTNTATKVFGVAPHEVTPDMRRRAKGVNFGIIYGITDYGLARDIGVSRPEAESYIKNYFRQYPSVKKFIEQTISDAREKGYVRTMLNRRRFLPDILSANRMVRAFGERTAMNTPIQGSAADIIKLAMLWIDRQLQDKGFQARMLLQVHDELIFEVPESEIQALIPLVHKGMENVVQLDVPLDVQIEIGPNWYDMSAVEEDNA
jgi:DNA polymerase-1